VYAHRDRASMGKESIRSGMGLVFSCSSKMIPFVLHDFDFPIPPF
jgi:hypothetical protein